MATLILASGSPYRQQLLKRLSEDFVSISPDIDETALPGEPPAETAARLAREKALHVARSHGDSVVIGSDQVAALDDRHLGKPGDHNSACAQLLACSGRRACFYTAVCVISEGRELSHIDKTQVFFRQLAPLEIDRYVKREQPFDCAGGFKAEGLGIALFDRIQSDDPTGLIGLPLIWLSAALRELGYPLLR